MHLSMVVTGAGLPLAVAAIKFWTRENFKGSNAVRRKIIPTRVPIEQMKKMRWLQNLQSSTKLLCETEGECAYRRPREIFVNCSAEHMRRRYFLVKTRVDSLAHASSTTVES